MKFEYWVIGKTKEKHWKSAEEEFLKRLQRYTKLNYRTFPDVKLRGNSETLKKAEADMVLGQCSPTDHLILLDENGKEYTSIEFSKKVSSLQRATAKRVIFLTGGAYGFHTSLYDRAQEKLALSKMTFSHQMVRTYFLEQLYRAFTITRGEKYHNE